MGSAEKTQLAAALGYDALFVREDFGDAVREATAGHGADLVLDPVGGPVRQASLQALAPFGRVVTYGDHPREDRARRRAARSRVSSP